MAIEKEEFFKIIENVSKNESGDLSKDNLLKKIRGELKEKDIVEYNKFDKEFSKEYQFGIEISEEAVEDWTLLHLAVACDNLSIVELLLEKKVNVNTRVKDGSKGDGPTALHIAASYGYENMVEHLLKDDRVNPSLKSKNKTPKDMVGDVSNKNTIVEMLEIAEKNYLPKKAKDLNIKIKGGGCYHLSQNNHKTQASLAVNENDAAATNGINSYSERCDSMHSDGSVSGYSSLESEQSETTSIRELENKLKELQGKIVAVVDFSSKREGELNDKLNRLAQEKKDLESKAEKLSREVDRLKEQQTNTQQKLDDTLKQLNDKDSRIRELEKSDKELKEVEKKLEKAQEDLEKLKDHLAKNETRQEALNKLDEENRSLKQKIEDLESKNTTLKGKLEENKDQHFQISEVSLKKVEKKPPLSKIAYVSLVTTSMVGSILIPSFTGNGTNKKRLFLPIIRELSKFITCPICLPNNECWYQYCFRIVCSIDDCNFCDICIGSWRHYIHNVKTHH